MPALETYIVTVTVQYEVAGNDHASAAKLVEDQVAPTLKPSARGTDYPVIRDAKIIGIEAKRR